MNKSYLLIFLNYDQTCGVGMYFYLCRSWQRHQCSQTVKFHYNAQFPLLEMPGGNHDWIVVLMNTASMIPCRRVSLVEGIGHCQEDSCHLNKIWYASDSNRHISNTLETRMVTIHKYFCIIRDGGWSRHVLKIWKRVKTVLLKRKLLLAVWQCIEMCWEKNICWATK